jgi:hypothetical protein
MDAELEKAKRDYDTAVSKIIKVGYLGGNGNERNSAVAFRRYALLNNADPTRPQMMIPKKKYRG